jgi:two-component system, NtrC family, sensor kinase
MISKYNISFRLSLFWKFSMAIITIVLLFGSINTYLIWNKVQASLEKETEKRGLYIAKSIANQVTDDFLHENIVALQQIVDNAVQIDSGIFYLLVLDKNNKVLVRNIEKPIPQNVLDANILAPNVSQQIKTLNPVDMSGIKIQDIVVPILSHELGSIRLGLIENNLRSEVRATVQVFWRMVGAFLLLGILGAFLFSFFISSQLLRIIGITDDLSLETIKNRTIPRFKVRKLVLGKLITIRSVDEIDQLGFKFNEMIRRLETAYDEIQSAQASLIHSEKLATVGTIAAGLAHELNNPLAGLQGCLRRLKSPNLSPQKRDNYIQMMNEGAKRIESVVSHLLNFSRKHDFSFIPVRVDQVIESSLLLVAYQLENSRVSIKKSFESDLPFVNGSMNHLEQVFVNLFLNSIDSINEKCDSYPENERRISIACRLKNNWIIINVEDTGIGIDEKNRTNIFEPLFTTKKIGKGTGLGLAVCYNIIQAHHGEIEVLQSHTQGANFRIILPVLK